MMFSPGLPNFCACSKPSNILEKAKKSRKRYDLQNEKKQYRRHFSTELSTKTGLTSYFQIRILNLYFLSRWTFAKSLAMSILKFEQLFWVKIKLDDPLPQACLCRYCLLICFIKSWFFT